MIDDRIAERRATVRDDRRRARLRRTLLALVVLGVLAGLAWVERSALVGLEEVQVEGVERLDEATVREAAALELGTSTLRLGLGAAEDRVAALPLVLTASARRADPLTVVLTVEERSPELVVIGAGVARYLDRDGIIIDDVDEDESTGALPVVELAEEPPPPGSRAADDASLRNAHATWAGLSGSLRAEVRTYRAAGPDELTLELGSGIKVRFGRAERMDEKIRALGAVLADVGDADVETIDVRAPSAPVVIGR